MIDHKEQQLTRLSKLENVADDIDLDHINVLSITQYYIITFTFQNERGIHYSMAKRKKNKN